MTPTNFAILLALGILIGAVLLYAALKGSKTFREVFDFKLVDDGTSTAFEIRTLVERHIREMRSEVRMEIREQLEKAKDFASEQLRR